MTVVSTNRINTYPGAGSAGPYPYTFFVFENAHLDVFATNAAGVITPFIEGVDYTMVGAQNIGGGSVTLTNPLAPTNTLTLQRLVPILQLTSLRNQGRFYPEVHEDTYDYSRMVDQQLSDMLTAASAIIETLSGNVDALSATSANHTTQITNILNALTTINQQIVTINNNITILQADDAYVKAQIDALWRAIINGLTYIGIANPMTAQGDMIIGGPTPPGTPTRLPVDAYGKILVMWKNNPGDPLVPMWLYLNLAGLATASGQNIPTPVKRVPFIYASPGSFSHTISAGVTSVEVEVWGAGGGGAGALGNNRSGGGPGGYVWGQLTVAPGDVCAVVVGAAGVADTSAGGNSSFKTTVLTATGGAMAATPGVGGGSCTNKRTIVGQPGSALLAAGGIIDGNIARGGAAPNGGVGALAWTDNEVNSIEQDAGHPGGGGAIAYGSSGANGAPVGLAADGMVIIWEYQ